MNAVLPTGIESYLKEAGFSATEMLILRKLVEEDSLTIRELAAKTGKSTGVLDQAMKKLLVKKIAQRNIINDQPRYSIQSLDSVVKWVKNDMQMRKETLDRKHQNFEQFIASLKVDKKRPDIEHFNGMTGIQQAYLKLVESGQELLTFTPIVHLTEDDPLRLFRVELFRKRQVRKIFQRILAPDTPLARRFQSRDPFEYRKTLLLPESELPLTFEKTIVGDTIACFNFKEETACFLRYPELAQLEKAAFESSWARAQALEYGSPEAVQTRPIIVVPLSTKIASAFRGFILSKKSIAVLVGFALVAGVMTFGLYKSNRALNLERIQEKVRAIAATGALQFDAKDIEKIRVPEDVQKPEYAKMIATLNLIRRSNENIQYTYIMRKTDKPQIYTFVADADSLDPTLKKDINADGKVDETDELNYPGEPYDISTFPVMSQAFEKPVSDFGEDQWGELISGFAPIKDDHGRAIAIVGIDMFAAEVDELSSQTFSPILVFIALFLVFFLIRFFALNRSLTKECCEYLSQRKLRTALWITFLILFLISAQYAFTSYANHLVLRETGERLRAIALSAVDEFDASDLEQLHFARDMKKESYQKVFKKLNEIRNRFPEVTFAYLMRPTKAPDLFEFIADADSNYNLPLYTKFDISDQTSINEADENIWPGVINDDSMSGIFFSSMKKSSFVLTPNPVDQWGSAITGCAPLIKENITVAILCLDINLY